MGIIIGTPSFLIPIILENLVFAYFAKMYDSGYVLSTVYILGMSFYTYTTPVYPNLRPDSVLLLRIMLVMIIFFKTAITDTIARPQKIETDEPQIKFKKKVRQKKDHVFYATILSFSLITVLFVSGVTGYFPISITSGSMYDSIDIGDVVVVEKLDSEKAASTLELGDVLVYKLDSIFVVHRIVKIGRSNVNNELYYVTKGDNNAKADAAKVSLNQVVGVTRYRMPYIGYPSIIARKLLATIS